MKINKTSLVDYVFMIVLLINGGTIIQPLGIGQEIHLVSFIFLISILLYRHNFLLKKKLLIIYVISSSLFGIVFILQLIKLGDLPSILNLQYINFFIVIGISVLISWQFKNRQSDFVKVLGNSLLIVLIHAILSLIFFNILSHDKIAFLTNRGHPYYTIAYIFFQKGHVLYNGEMIVATFNLLGIDLYRAHGIFWEPSVFSIYVNIFVFLNLFIFKKFKYVILGMSMILLAWSTTGILILMIQLVYFLIVNIELKKRSLILVILLGIITIPLIYFGLQNLNEKIYGDKEGSAAQRFTDTFAAVEVIKNNPVFGIGVSYDRLENQIKNATPKFMDVIREQLDLNENESNRFSNSLLRLFIYFGIPIGSILLFSFFNQNLILKNKGLYAIINLLGVSAAPILFLPFHFTFIIDGAFNISRKYGIRSFRIIFNKNEK